MSHEQISQRIAARVYFDELAASRALGADGVACYVSAFRAMDETYGRAFAPDRPHITLPARMIGNMTR